MTQTRKIHNPDIIGAIAGVLCFIHCVATPFLFVAKACSASCCADSPFWWKIVDYVFIVIAFWAVYLATRNTSKQFIKIALWVSWTLLFVTILDESFAPKLLPDGFIYLPASSMIGLHFYNLRYGECQGSHGCVHSPRAIQQHVTDV